MASSITPANGTAFGTANIKPDSDEEIVALWGQNIGDNLAYLAASPKMAIQMGPSAIYMEESSNPMQIVGSSAFLFSRFHGTLVGTFSCDVPFGANLSSAGFSAKYDGTTITSGADVDNQERPFRKAISHFPTGSDGKPIPVTVTVWGTSASSSPVELQFIGLVAWLEV